MPGPERSTERVREMCRRLQPIIGAQAERIWLAYVAENEEGREQIENYLELLGAQYFQETLQSPGPGLVPVSPVPLPVDAAHPVPDSAFSAATPLRPPLPPSELVPRPFAIQPGPQSSPPASPLCGCGKALEPQSRFCSSCGAPVRVPLDLEGAENRYQLPQPVQ